MAKLQDSTSGRRFTDQSDRFNSVIGEDVIVSGEIKGPGDIEIRGAFEGRIEVEGLAWVSKTGKVKGEVIAKDVVVEGEVQGTTTASNKVDLRQHCRLEGQITAGSIAAAEGSFFEAKISMPGGKGPEDVVSYQEKREEAADEGGET